MEEAQLNMSPVSDLPATVDTVEAFETWLVDGPLQPIGCKSMESRTSRARAEVFNCLRPATKATPEPDAMCSIEHYAALEDIMDVDSESMAFHEDEFEEGIALQQARLEHSGEKRERKGAAQVERQVKTEGKMERKHRDKKRSEKNDALCSVVTRGARTVVKKGAAQDLESMPRKRKRGIEEARGEDGAAAGMARSRRKNGEKKAVEGETDDKNIPVKDKCMRCSTTATNTPMMRKGPDGCRSLCNACGLKWSRHGIY